MVSERFEYLVACQMYGEQVRSSKQQHSQASQALPLSDPPSPLPSRQKRSGDTKADDVDLLLELHPGLRVVYVDRTPPPSAPRELGGGGEATYDAVLLVSEGGRGVEHARVRLPGNPILGEGKPENQNIGLPFTRGVEVDDTRHESGRLF